MAHMPWRNLDEQERTCLLSLVRKMIAAEPAAERAAAGTTSSTPTSTTTPPSTGGEGAGEVSDTLITAQHAG